MAPHSSILAWKIPWMAEPGRLQSMGSLWVGTERLHFHFSPAIHSSVLAWRVPGTGEPGGLPSMVPHRVGHDWSDLAAANVIMASLVAQMVNSLPIMQGTGFDLWVGKIPWRKKWQPTPVFLPEETYEQRNLVGYSPWGCKKSDMTEVT